VIYLLLKAHGSPGFFSSSYGTAISVGAVFGLTMWANVWFVIWPKQKIVMASAEQVANGGAALPNAADAAAKLKGVAKVLLADDANYANQLAEPVAALMVSLASGYSAIVSASTSSGKNIMPRAAALLDVMQVSDVIRVISADTFERPIYAGNALHTVQSTDTIKVLTVRTASFASAEEGGNAPVEAASAAANPGLSSFKGESLAKLDRPELTSAKIIVSGGRAMANAENFKTYIEPVANRLNAAMGASRAAVDAGYAPNDWQVGQTGKVVAPDLYIAVGISGAIQHLAGMRTSKVIVAINTDPDAPIFTKADYGIVGDLFQIVPLMTQEFKNLLGK
jgi:electron transfer flavoprotein alpha subunit